MESITHTLKTFILFYLGIQLKHFVFGAELSFFFNLIFYVVLLWLVFKHYKSYQPMPVPRSDFNVCIIGAGFSGMGMAIKLQEIGVKYTIVEKGARFGGTWWDNLYPGCACDVPSHLYSFSFEPNPDWSKSFSPQPEIHEYLERVAEKHDLSKHVHFQKRVVKTTWDESNSQWEVELDNGETLTANILVSGSGALHVPVIPEFPGRDSFRGDAFHSARWRKDWDPSGKRVAVIGTGASAVQIVPNIADKVKHLAVFQRTPCWVPPKDMYEYPTWLRTVFRFYPLVMFIHRNFFFWRNEFRFFSTFRVEGIFRKLAVKVMTERTMTEVHDAETAKKLIPSFEMGCKRVTPSNGYLQAFNRENVALVTEGIDCFTENGIKTKDGTTHEFDTIIYATGFSPKKSVGSTDMYGRNGFHGNSSDKVQMNGSAGHSNGRMSLREEWDDFPNAYNGITYPGYPNTFFLLGPGTGLGHNSVVYMIECQVAYVTDAIRKMIESNVKSVDVKRGVNDGYQEWVQECMKNKVFNSSNCMSWYKNKKEVNYVLWPSHLAHYWWVTRNFDIENYACKYN